MRFVSDRRTMLGMATSNRTGSRRVVIAGAGIAALETVLALRTLSGRLRVTVIAPEPLFAFQYPNQAQPPVDGDPGRLDLARFMEEHDGHFRRTAVLSVDSESHTVRCGSGPDEPYDVLVVAVGASGRPAFRNALMIGAESPMLGGLLAELELGYSSSIAFVVPKAGAWSVPLYELAMMVADGVSEMAIENVRLHLVTAEHAPLEILGPEADIAVRRLLDAARIALHCDVGSVVSSEGRIDTGSGESLEAERVVALPALSGPRLQGVPGDVHGFIPVDDFGRVTGVSDIYAAGDATDRPLKQGALACLQADTVAAHIAASADGGADVTPYSPALRGRLFTDADGRFLARGKGSNASDGPARSLWWPPGAASGRLLAPYLDAKGVIGSSPHDERTGIDVALPLGT